jgi:hypothetical protein
VSYSYSKTWRSQGDLFARDHGQWEFSARPLLRAAELCWAKYLKARVRALKRDFRDEVVADIALAQVAHYLAAMGLESLLKAIALLKSPDLATSGQQLFYTHDLLQIAKTLAGLKLDRNESLLLRRLATLIDWAGRYPVPRWDSEKKQRKYDVRSRSVDGNETIDASQLPSNVSPETWKAIQKLVGKLYFSYQLACSEPKPSLQTKSMPNQPHPPDAQKRRR